jgi:3',5'-cyclic AMP phosphodiesterase CpdA
VGDVINILHLSDMHVQNPPVFDQKVIHDALCTDLRLQLEAGTGFDFCIFTGDVAYGGQCSEYDRALDQIVQLLSACGLDDSRLILLPGNHDASREAIGPKLDRLQQFRAKAITRDGANSLAESDDFADYCRAAFANFTQLEGEFCRSSVTHADPFCTVYSLPTVAIIALNTGLLTAGA